MWVIGLVAAIMLVWVLVGVAARNLTRNPRGEVGYGLLRWLGVSYALLWQRVRFEGQDVLAGIGASEGVVVIANHTAGVDPILIQVGWQQQEIRWVMTSEMRVRVLDPLWLFLSIIFVGGENERKGASELSSLKEMIRHVKGGRTLGIFPEGRIARPAGTLHEFQPGVGMVLAKSGARVLPVVIEGTPQTQTAWSSLFHRGKARVRYLPLIETKGKKGDALVAELQSLFERELGVKAIP